MALALVVTVEKDLPDAQAAYAKAKAGTVETFSR